MKLFVGVTDYQWYEALSWRTDLTEVNFWSPGGKSFKVLSPGELFLFKLKADHGHVVVGGGIFGHDTRLPLSLAWDAFGRSNGADSMTEMINRIRKYQSADARTKSDPVIGCRLVQSPFFLSKAEWFRVPETFPVNAVSGKSYSSEEAEGTYLFDAIKDRLTSAQTGFMDRSPPTNGWEPQEHRRGTPQMVLPRLGQGTFRVAVMDGYGRRCAVTGERTLPILDAAHIKPWSQGGEHSPGNGILLRTDIHRLFDLGYVTIDESHRFDVSPKLKEDYENGRHYYALRGQKVRLPDNDAFMPTPAALQWHHENRWAKPGSLLVE